MSPAKRSRTFNLDHLIRQFLDLLPSPARYWLGFSGGLDSTALLHALACVRDRLPAPLAAVHIDHGLQGESAAWAQHCRDVCRRLELPLHVIEVDAKAAPGESPEAAARNARYAAIDRLVGEDEMLLTAHHLDDQAETVMLQLMRGAGVDGLSAMPLVQVRGKGWHARPLLPWRRSALLDWARQNDLDWVEDPSNVQTDADRNFLRHQVLPQLLTRWPAAIENLAGSAAHCADASATLRAQARVDLAQVQGADGARLAIDALARLPESRQRNLLRAWLRDRAVPPLPQRRLADALDQVLNARPDADVCIAWAGWQLRRFRRELWLLPAGGGTEDHGPVVWRGDEMSLGGGRGTLQRRLAPGGIDPAIWEKGRVEIGYRSAGMKCRPAGRQGSRSFKKLMQEYGVPSWQRAILPVVLIDGQPAAIANCCVCEPFAAPQGTPGWVIAWIPEENLPFEVT